MKTFKKAAAQGDVYFVRVKNLPEGLTAAKSAAGGGVIVAHSETGHHHMFRKDSGVELFETSNPLVCYLRCSEPLAELEHLRPFDTHESIGFAPGIYEVHRQREWTPEGWQRVAD